MWQPPFGTMQVELREWHKRPDGQGRGVSNEIMQQLIFSVAKIQNFIHLLDESEYWGRGDPTTINLSNRSKTWNTWNIGRPNRANWVMRIRHSVRALGTRFTQKTFGVYPSTFSILEAHRVYQQLCILKQKLYIHGGPQWQKRSTDKLQRFFGWNVFLGP